MKRLFCLLAAVLISGTAAADDYPNRPIRLVLQYAAGGGADVVARILANELPPLMNNQQLVIDNRPGANGTVANQIVAQSKPDGYTLLLSGGSAMVINPHLYGKGPVDTLNDFIPVALAVSTRFILVVHNSVPANNLVELIKLAKEKPGTLNYGSSGIASAPHMAGALLAHLAGIDIVHVPYRGTGQAINDLLAGQVQMTFADVGLFTDYLKNGTLKAMGGTGPNRSRILTSLPTFKEQGLPTYEAGTYYAIHAPAGMDPAMVTKLNLAVRQAMKGPSAQARYAIGDHEPSDMNPEEFKAFQLADYERWGNVIKAAGIKVDQ